MASNLDDVLNQLRSAGLLVDGGLEIGTPRPVRCLVEGGGRERRGWYRLYEMPTTAGDILIVGSFGIWHGNENNAQKVTLAKGAALSAEQRETLKRRLAEDRRRLELERKRQAERAALRANAAWSRLLPDAESDYLAGKGVRGHGLRYTQNGTAVVPLLDTGGRMHGLQFLRSAKQAEACRRPAKEFWPAGLVKRGHFHLLGTPDWLVIVAEGYATAATLHEATGYPVAVAFDAGNLEPVATALRKRYKRAKILIAADDDVLAKCRNPDCRGRVVLSVDPITCPHCGEAHSATNAGITAATSAAIAVDGAWVAPVFADDAGRIERYRTTGRKLTDFNDLHAAEGLHVARTQVEARLTALSWRPKAIAPSSSNPGGGDDRKLRPIQNLDDLLPRFSLVYAAGGAVFDRKEHCLLPITDMRNICIRADLHKAWMEHPERDIVRQEEVGFDPACTDASVTCNLWSGWPTTPRAGNCDRLLDLLRFLCSDERNRSDELFNWVLRWVAYPIQHPGAKMKTTIVVHGGQGAGKNLFFECVMGIYGKYGRILDQDALVDKHNDWASRKLFLIADEVVAQAHRFELKNKLKTLITGTQIRINPKHIAAYDEANHCNLVFLSNEDMPAVLEEDDRRHCVIWTPAERKPDYYAAIRDEIAAGGIEALHDYLLHLDLGDFHPGTRPPETEAKRTLQGLARDTPLVFADALVTGDIGKLQAIPGLTTDWYAVYQRWCSTIGEKPAPMKRFLNTLERKRGFATERRRYLDGQTVVHPKSVLTFGLRAREGTDERDWLGEQIHIMKNAMADYRGGLA
ncbi:DUF5906 domain-containing protein [Luteimonas sp BLCC-B24]|uniref:DUF5906 domain-containing protein n=1 Tax=Luteimonas sp. BLCC-B24 TaxID=3025317 RepID=UPI00234DEFD4|nr:DUF5906 domain-containing protein [Luteimonas sp. BLCC-B24]MDC7806407.1 DUF5906 domain-containing protein [Luteimonas sp. BLCC-B24]